MAPEVALRSPRLRVVRAHDPSPRAIAARAERSARRSLALLTVSVLVLTTGGLVMVLSASSVSAFAQYGSSFLFFKRQLIYAVLGTAGALAMSRIRYQVWQRAWAPMYVVVFILLVLVLLPSVGTVAGGAARWLSFGPVTVQPSEPAKVVVVMAVAAILTRHLGDVHQPSRWAPPLLFIVGLITLLILAQPDFGTATIVAGAVFIAMFVAGARLLFLLLCAAVAGACALGLILGWDYRRERLLSFLDPWSDPRNTGYQVVQSLIALGSGHLLGVGLGASRQKWMYVPNAHTDFIFAILGEELGLVGELVVLALFVGIVYAGVRIAIRAPDPFGRLLAGGITGLIGLQALVNLGAVTGLLPITGVPLPFMSFGGSSLVVSLLGVGILMSIGRAGLATAGQRVAAARKGPASQRGMKRPGRPR